ncbi:MAG: hypothetical protein R3F37_04445 [Candidatus Competibacteraceae bacterium]
MGKGVKDSAGFYRLTPPGVDVEARLRFDRGTLVLEGSPLLPADCESFFHYDPRVDAYRAPAYYYGRIIGPLKASLARNQAPRYQRHRLSSDLPIEPYPHQQEALSGWQAARGQGIVVLPTGAGKTWWAYWPCVGLGGTA